MKTSDFDYELPEELIAHYPTNSRSSSRLLVGLNEIEHRTFRDITDYFNDGDLLKVDTGAFYNGYHGDSCITICVGNTSDKAVKLSRVAKEALMLGIQQIKPQNKLLDIAGAIEDHVRTNGFSVVEDYTGHGVGRNLHEEPSVFNFRTNDLPNVTLREGMTIAVEPIINLGSKHCKTLRDGWTVITKDGNLSAQWEHTVLVTKNGFEILTDRGD